MVPVPKFPGVLVADAVCVRDAVLVMVNVLVITVRLGVNVGRPNGVADCVLVRVIVRLLVWVGRVTDGWNVAVKMRVRLWVGDPVVVTVCVCDAVAVGVAVMDAVSVAVLVRERVTVIARLGVEVRNITNVGKAGISVNAAGRVGTNVRVLSATSVRDKSAHWVR